ncbi:MAG: hypothetical protein V2A65_06010, partial [Candidatus Omnitrophota bacterium]
MAVVIAFLFAFLCSLFIPSQASAVQIKRIQRGTSADFTVDDLSQTIDLIDDLGGVAVTDLSKAMVILSSKGGTDAAGDGNFFFTPYFEDTRTVAILRDVPGKSTGVAGATIHVVEFSDGVTVYRGFSSLAKAAYTKTINFTGPIADITHKAFPIIYTRGPIATNKDTEVLLCKSSLSTDANGSYLTITRNRSSSDAGITQGINIAWQVVVLETDAKVRVGSVTIPNTAATSATFNLTTNFSDPADRYAISDISKALLLFDYSPGIGINGIEAHSLTRGTINSTTELLFRRLLGSTGAGDNVDINFSLIEFSDPGTVVKKNTSNIASATLSVNITPLPDSISVDTMRSFPYTSVSGGLTTGTDYIEDISVMAKLTTATNLNLTRGIGEIACDVDYFITQFAPLTLKTPNGNEKWVVGTTYDITWKYADSVSVYNHKVRIDLDTNGGGNDYNRNIISDIRADSGIYHWNIPEAVSGENPISSNCKIKITDTTLTDTWTYDVSNAAFKIMGSLNILAPNGPSDIFYPNQANTITWSKTGNLTTPSRKEVKLYYSANSGTSYSEIDSGTTKYADNLQYSWNIPNNMVPGTTYRIRENLVGDESDVCDTSNADFPIKAKLILTAPVGSETLLTQKTSNITWTHGGTNLGQVNLYYSTQSGVAGSWNAIACAGTNGDSDIFQWTVPADPATTCRVKISLVSDTTVESVSPANFTILASVKVTSPDDGTELWRVLEAKNITWIVQPAAGIANVKIQYSINGGTSWVDPPITTSWPADIAYEWSIPDNISNTCRVRVSDATKPDTVFDVSDNNFKIKGSLFITYPVGGESFLVGSTENIKWDYTGSLGNVEVKYSHDGTGWVATPIATNIPAGNKTVPWSPVPNEIDSTVYVKVYLMSDASGVYSSTTTDTPPLPFAIKGGVHVDTPNGYETFYVGGSTPVNWTKNGDIGDVEVRYSLDGGSTFPGDQVIKTAESGTSCTWTPIPDKVGDNIRVVVFALGDASVSDTSNANSKIRGTINLTYPNGGAWEVGTPGNITWDVPSALSMGKVELKYSTDGGTTYPDGNTITPAGGVNPDYDGGKYPWTPAGTLVCGANYRVRIQALDFTDIKDESTSSFEIKGKIKLDSPDTDVTTWYVGDTNQIKWTPTGTYVGSAYPNVEFHYATDGVNFDTAVSPDGEKANTATGVQGTANWEIPNKIGAGVKVRVRVKNSPTTVEWITSNAFKILGKIDSITSPIANEVWNVGDTTRKIQWSATGSVTNVRIDYKTSAGGSWIEPPVAANDG